MPESSQSSRAYALLQPTKRLPARFRCSHWQGIEVKHGTSNRMAQRSQILKTYNTSCVSFGQRGESTNLIVALARYLEINKLNRSLCQMFLNTWKYIMNS